MANVYLAYLSLFDESRAREVIYTTDEMVNNVTIKGKQTNEAAFQYIEKILESKGEKIDKVIFVCTKEVVEKGTYEYFIKTRNIDEEIIEKVTALKGESINNISEILDKIGFDDKIYLDITGGMRDTVYLMALISRFLEFAGNRIEMAVYSNKETEDKGSIKHFTEILGLMNLINGASEFINFGNSKTLMEFFGNTKNENQYIKEVISAMEKFSDIITMGKLKDLDKIAEELNLAIENLKEQEMVSNEDKLFVKMIPVIQRKFFKGQKEIDYISLMEWCLENNLIQQALTLYTEKIPKCIFGNKLIEYDKKVKQRVKVHKKEYEDLDAKIFYGDFMENMEVKGKVAELRVAMKKICKSGCTQISYKMYESDKNIGQAVKKLHKLMGVLKDKDLDYYRKNRKEISKNKEFQPYLKILLDESTSDYPIQDKSNKFLSKLLGVESTIMDFIKNAKVYLKEKEEEYKINIEISDVIKLMQDYVYFKTTRNEINHASEKENFTLEDKKYFKSLGFHVEIDGDSLTVSGLTEDMKKSLDFIKSLIKIVNI